MAADPVLKQKVAYDNPTAFLLRTIVFFIMTIVLAMRLRRLVSQTGHHLGFGANH